MKIRHPLLIRAIGALGATAVRLWVGSLKFTYAPLGPNLDPRTPGFVGRYIYAFWHENLLLPANLYGSPNVYVLISRHADGQIINNVLERLKFRSVRGSSTRGGVEAVRKILHLGGQSHVVVSPDGPRGPRRSVQPGVAYLASRTGLPVVPFGVGYDRPWRANSWDRFAVPRPFTRAVLVTGDPIEVPAGAGREELEHFRCVIQDAFTRVTEAAENWAVRGVPPDVSGPARHGRRMPLQQLRRTLWCPLL